MRPGFYEGFDPAHNENVHLPSRISRMSKDWIDINEHLLFGRLYMVGGIGIREMRH
jgi:hypothetical protein